MSTKNQHLVVTAGPTREALDPVRFLSNQSSGTFGYEIARVAVRRGHTVTLISGPTALKPPAGVEFIPVITARQMGEAIHTHFARAQALIMAAAVADYRPKKLNISKIKKTKGLDKEGGWALELVPNPDLVAEASSKRRPGQIVVGFSLDSRAQWIAEAKRKLREKGLDLMVACRLEEGKGPFGDAPLSVAFVVPGDVTPEIHRGEKPALARQLLDKLKPLC
ncbi:MAG: phosphopantothenoylcysteine decarboxylase [Candidatus Omnitrophica bacterium]|nr:phosphopantothenoylcysteine decarboxylase [Candidatus Omnitrophota bacterium]